MSLLYTHLDFFFDFFIYKIYFLECINKNYVVFIIIIIIIIKTLELIIKNVVVVFIVYPFRYRCITSSCYLGLGLL